MNSSNKIYFQNLDALRFFAFFVVFMAHAWRLTFNGMVASPFILWLKDYVQIGVLGVNFFFVLSGFLITYLLFAERERTGNNSLLRFYERRTLRIWPLYFGIVLSTFYLLPLAASLFGKTYHEPTSIIYYLFFAINFMVISGIKPYSSQLMVLWSVAVEEQFYITWPVLFKVFFKKITWVFIFIILFSVGFRFIYMDRPRIIYLHTFSIISDFAVGGYVAYSAFYRNKIFRWFQSLSKGWIFAAYSLIAITVGGYNIIFHSGIATVFERLILGTMFGFIIFEQTFSAHSFFKAGEVDLFTWLGKISYGLYCFHALGIIFAMHILVKLNFITLPFQYMVIFPFLALIITIILAWLSYNFYEKWFLKLKEKISFQH